MKKNKNIKSIKQTTSQKEPENELYLIAPKGSKQLAMNAMKIRKQKVVFLFFFFND